MKNFKKISVSLLITLSLLMSGCTSKPKYEEPKFNTEHTSIDFNELKYERPNVQNLESKITEAIALSKEDGKEKELLESYDAILESVINYDVMQGLASLYSSVDVKDEYYSSESEFLDGYYTKLDNQMLDLTKTILDSTYANAFKEKMGEEFIKRYEVNSKLNSPEIEELSTKETALITEYSKASVDTYTTTYNGQEVTIDDLDFTDPNVSTPYFEIYQKKNAVTGEIYRNLVQTRVEIAKKLGYDSYADYAYEGLGYDFTAKDASKLEEYVVKNIAPLYQTLSTKYSEDIGVAKESISSNFEDGIPTLEKAIQAEFPEYMLTALNYMLDNNMYMYTDNPNATQGAYTTFINGYKAPFMFINTALYTDSSTVFHEFGHYYNFFHYFSSTWNDGNDLNLAEVHSQGLEVLMHPYYEELYGEDAQLMKYDNLMGMLNSILQGCAEDEFQRKVFENPTMSLDEMNQLHGDIFTKYMGYPIYYEWVDIHHHYETPFYYISYATSAVSALELWTIDQKDRTKALDIYDKITKYPANSHYLAALESVGLSNPFNSDVMSDIAKALEKEMN